MDQQSAVLVQSAPVDNRAGNGVSRRTRSLTLSSFSSPEYAEFCPFISNVFKDWILACGQEYLQRRDI